MIAYADSSVLLRFLFEQRPTLASIERFERLVTSTITLTECLRAVDNARLRGEIDPDEHDARRRAVYDRVRGLERVVVSSGVLDRAAAPFPAPVATLDAIHLATALQWRERGRPDMVFATHDVRQARVAELLGFEVTGI